MLAIRSEKTPQTRPFHPQSPWIAFSRDFCMKAASLAAKWHVSRIFFQYLFPFVKEDLARNVRDIWMQGKNRNIQFFFPILIDVQHDLISWFSAQYELNCRLYWCMLHHDTNLLRISLRHRYTLLKIFNIPEVIEKIKNIWPFLWASARSLFPLKQKFSIAALAN